MQSEKNNTLLDTLKRNRLIVLALLVLLIYLSPNIFMPHQARYLIHDNLNSNVVWYKNLAESGKVFAGNQEIVPQSLGGLPRGCYPSELSLIQLLYWMFSPLAAYNINIVLMHLLAFFSMYVFTRKYFFREGPQWPPVLISLVFALLPFWPSGGGAITCQPLVLYAFLNILKGERKWTDWLILLLVPFYSSLALSGLFFIITLSAGFLFYTIYKRKINFRFVLALALFSIVSVVVEYRLFLMQFVEHFQSHRAIIAEGTLNLKGVIGISLRHFLKGHYHFISLQTPFVLFLAILALLFARSKKEKMAVLALLAGLFFISLAFILPGWDAIASMMKKSSLLNALTLRFYSLFPLLWFIVFAWSAKLLVENGRVWLKCTVIAAGIASCVFLLFSFQTADYYSNKFAENSFCNTFIRPGSEEHASFDEYYQPALFNEVKKEIPTGNYYVACLGVESEVLQYNGYHTIDGYFYYYPKSYHELITAISVQEIQKSGFKNIGSHCQLVSDDLKKGKSEITDLQLDFTKMKALGTHYLFSGVKIVCDSLQDERVYGTPPHKLFVYTIR